MDLTELQILFQQKIEDVSDRFTENDRPDSFTIVNYLNKSIDRYLREKYVNLPNHELRLAAISANIDELYQLITTEESLENYRQLTNFNWGGRGLRWRLPENMLIPYSLSIQISRVTVYPMTNQKVFAMFVNRRQAEKLVSHSTDKVMFDKPVFFLEDNYYLVIVGDAYIQQMTNPVLTFVKKPFDLSYEYNELTASTRYGDLDINSLASGSYFLMKSYSLYVDSGGNATYYKPGDKVQKIAGYNTVSNYAGTGEQVKIGYPWGYINTPEFPEHIHEKLVDIAVQMFLEEGKLKLVPKSESK